ncbi:MAG: phthiocerol/phthiodiolone dimycocerosyl transferase family protein [Devosia sp.]
MSKSRPVGEQERLFHYLHSFGALVPMQVMHIHGPLDPALVARALDWLQRQHPILRAHIRYGRPVFRNVPPFVYRQPYFDVDGTSTIPLSVVEGRWEDVLEKQMRKPLRGGRSPRMRVTLVRDGQDEELTHLMICADHATLDAQSGNMVSRQLLEYLADAAAMEARQPVHAQLPPPLETAMPMKPDSGARTYQPAIRLPRQRARGDGSATHVVTRRINAVATEALKAAAKANGATLHGATSAAFLLALREKYNIREMTCLSTVDLRRLCKPPLPAETYGCYIDILRTRHTIGAEFWPIAQDVSFKLISSLARDQETSSILKFPDWGVFAAETWPTLSNHLRIDGLTVTTAGESGLRTHYGNLTLVNVTMALSLGTFGPSLMVIGSERQGALDLCVCHSAKALPDTDAADLTDRALTHLTIDGPTWVA